MTAEQAALLKTGDRITHLATPDEVFIFVRLDSDGDCLTQNATGAPTLIALYRRECQLAE